MVVNCERVWREVCNYLEGEVDPTLRSAMEEHFATCARCKSVLEGTRNVVALYGDERMLEVPAGFSRRLERRLGQNARTGRSGWSTWSAWMVPVAAMALMAGALQLASSLTFQPPLKSEHAQPGRDIPPDMQVLVTADTRTFHVAGCTFIHNKSSLRTLTAKEAIQQGYVPCVRCLRKYLEVAAGHYDSKNGETAEEQAAEEQELRQAGH
jgi:Putative zinc-finger